jgi:hypothetical protein
MWQPFSGAFANLYEFVTSAGLVGPGRLGDRKGEKYLHS